MSIRPGAVEAMAGEPPCWAATVALRPAQAADQGFLRCLFASTRADELAGVGWTDGEKEAFLAMQFAAREAAYLAQFPDATDSVVLIDGHAAGRLYVDRAGNQIHVIDLALLPAFRGAGAGSRLLGHLTAESRETGRPVRLFVGMSSPALRLYERLGFQRAGESPPYLRMEWSATNEGVRDVDAVYR